MKPVSLKGKTLHGAAFLSYRNLNGKQCPFKLHIIPAHSGFRGKDKERKKGNLHFSSLCTTEFSIKLYEAGKTY